MNRFYFAKTNKAALFFAMALLPSAMAYAQVKRDTAAKEKKIEEVVVIGYGTQRKEAVTGSVATVKGETLREVPTANITQALQSRTAGVEINQTSTRPGATMKIRIRGTRSLTDVANDPLIVLDGIPFVGSLGDISSSDIKSIDILKDASATAIYGSRGANGVILVTTNRGTKGQKPRFTYNSFTGSQTLFSRYPMMNGPQLSQLRRDANNLIKNGDHEKDGVDTDWQKLYYKPAMITNHDVAVSGGTDGGNYNAGLSYLKQDAIVPLQSYERFGLRIGLDQQVGKSFKFGFTTNSNYVKSEGNGIAPAPTLGYSPLASPYDEFGNPRRTLNMSSNMDQAWVYTRKSLDELGDKYIDETMAFSSYNNLYGEVKLPIDGLKYRINVGLDFRTSNSGNYTGVGVFSTNPASFSSAGRGNSQTYHWTIENLLTYDKTFGKHKINAVALYSSEQNTITSSYISAKNVPADFFQYYNLGQSPQTDITVRPQDQSYIRTGLVSYMGRAMYTFDNKYMITATLRADGASVLAEGHKWNTYPAISVGWNVANESFMQNFKFVNLFKLRYGWGETSNQAIGPYTTLGSLTVNPYNFGAAYATGVSVNTAPNPFLAWEYSRTHNAGLDFGFFNNRINGTVEYYKTHTYGILQNKSLPPTAGIPGGILENVGDTENKGWEASLNGIIIDNPNGFSWDAGINWYANRNKILSLASGVERDINNLWFVGYNINALYDYQYIGLWQKGDPYLKVLEPQIDSAPGMIKVLYTGGYKADGTPERQIGPNDMKVYNTNPDWQGGFNMRFAYKGFELSTVGAFQKGGILISSIYGPTGYLNRLTGRGNNVDVDYYTDSNTDALFPKPGGTTSGDNPKYLSTLAMFDGSYVKLRTLTLGYNLDKDFLKDLNINSLRIYFTVTNPLIIYSPYHRFSGMDPEPNSTGDQNQAVTSGYKNRQLIIGTNNPATRNFIMGINLSF